ncbi:MAG: multicopper oxidase family protein [Dermatophilaceae bacterium]
MKAVPADQVSAAPVAVARRRVLRAGLALAAGAGLGGCAVRAGDPRLGSRAFPSPPPLTPAPGRRVVDLALRAAPASVDLGGPVVSTWAYGGTVPGPPLRASAGDVIRLTLTNTLPAPTTVHCHGIRLRNAADGVPGLTQDPVAPGARYLYEFVAPDPGTYFVHPHVGVQLDRGLYAALVVDDPHEPGGYDEEWQVVLDDWLDGTGRTPDDVFGQLAAGAGGMGRMGRGMGGAGDKGDTGDTAGAGGMGGMHDDVDHPFHLIGGRVASSPVALRTRPGCRVRLRLVNAAASTVYTVALGGHRMTVTHTDGVAVRPTETGAALLGMGERLDAVVRLRDGVFPLVAEPQGSAGTRAMALVRTSTGDAPEPGVAVPELTGPALQLARLAPAEATRMPARQQDRTADVVLQRFHGSYRWGINGAPYGENEPLAAGRGQRLRAVVTNRTMAAHPLHIHGHTVALASGLRKDTLLVPPMRRTTIDLQADNPGDWMIHCHHAYHAEAGMMIALHYDS